MSLFLNNNPNPENTKFSDVLIHSYSKKCFNDYNDAVTNLTNKCLLPGETAYAYYYDELSPYGQSAIFGVGPLTHGSGNIIFKNAWDIEDIENTLNESIADVNASINYLRDDLYNDLQKVLIDINNGLKELEDKVNGPLNLYDISINYILNEFPAADTSIMNVVNTSYNEIKEHINTSYIELNSLITDLSINVYNKIEETSTYIISYINKAIYEGLTSSGNETDDKVTDVSNSIGEALNIFKLDLIDLINTTNNNLDVSINLLTHHVNGLDGSVNYNTLEIIKIEDTISHIIDTSYIEKYIDEQTNIIDEKINQLNGNIPTDYNVTINELKGQIESLNTIVTPDKMKTIDGSINYLENEIVSLNDKISHILIDIQEIKTNLNL